MATNPVNAQNRAFFADLHEALDWLDRDHAGSPVVLTGTGTRFSAGLDLASTFHSSLATGPPWRPGSASTARRTCGSLPTRARPWRP
jgi:enoyl-CoA hydratase/carnithine racemase